MIELSNKKTIGLSMLFDIDMKNGTAEFGHKISAPAEDRIRGDVVDAVNGMLNYAFNYLRLNCVTARVIEGNIFAEKTLRKVGFQLEGTLRQRVFQEGGYLDMNSFSITKDEFNSKRGEVKNEL
jgi:RimJ/RimL family protein N-acetyltransferase